MTSKHCMYCVGNVLFLNGYADTTLDVKSARYKKGGPLKPVGMLITLVTAISAVYSMARG